MDSSNQHDHQTLSSAKEEVDTILKKYDLCGFLVMASQTNGIQGFSFQKWSGMEWEIDDNGRMIGTKITLNMNQHNIADTCQMLMDCYAISEYFADVLSKQAEHMQKINDNLTTAFNLDLKQRNYPEKMH